MKIKPISEQNSKRLDYLSTYLRELRFNEGLTQKELSQNLNLHRNTIVRAENAQNITLITLFELVDAHELTLKELFLDIE